MVKNGDDDDQSKKQTRCFSVYEKVSTVLAFFLRRKRTRTNTEANRGYKKAGTVEPELAKVLTIRKNTFILYRRKNARHNNHFLSFIRQYKSTLVYIPKG